ncbi:MAG: hypothetical protein JWN85_1790 [Gammaproteobacteria bacterium]|nr:hypothetical protein [Gammaproteobacteria bacterium]
MNDVLAAGEAVDLARSLVTNALSGTIGGSWSLHFQTPAGESRRANRRRKGLDRVTYCAATENIGARLIGGAH